MGFSNPAVRSASQTANPNQGFSISRYVGSKNPVAGDLLRKILGDDQAYGGGAQPQRQQIEVNPQAIMQARPGQPRFGGLDDTDPGLLPMLDFFRGRP